MSLFLTNAELVERYDANRIGDFILDTNVRATLVQVLASTVVESAILDSEGDILASALVGKRYTKDQLAALAQSSEPDGRVLKRLTADLAFGYLVARRGVTGTDFATIAPRFAAAESKLVMLRMGEVVFAGIPGVPDAGLPGTADMTPRLGLDNPSITQNGRIFGSVILGNRCPNTGLGWA